MFVYWHNEERVGIKFIRQLDEIHLKNNKKRTVVLLSIDGPTAFSKRMTSETDTIVIVQGAVREHYEAFHGPPHRKLQDEEIEDLKKGMDYQPICKNCPKCQ